MALRSCLLVASCLLATAGRGMAVDWPVPRGESHEPAPYRYDPGVLKRAPTSFLDDAPACTLYAGINYLIEEDGTVETIVHEIIRFNGRKAVESLGEHRGISYDPAYEKLTLNEARVLKSTGRSVPVEPRHIQLRDVGTDYQVYDASKQLVISFPNLEVGDAVEIKWSTRGKNPEHHGQFFTRYTFGDDKYPVVLDELFIRLPKRFDLKHATVGGKLEPEIKEQNGQRLYHWRAVNRPRLPSDDHLPSKEELRLEVVCSTFASWQEVYQWKQRLRAECWKCTPEVRAVVRELTQNLKTPEEKARVLTAWVRQHIRYVSVGEKHDFTPHLPGLVLANRFGDCKDQSQLLAVMLREAQVPVALATLGARGDGQVLPEVTSPWGTHAILLVKLDGTDHWIDTTASLAAWDHLPLDDRDRLVYLVDDKELRLMRTPAATSAFNRIEQTTQVFVGTDGSSHCERSSIYHGAAAVSRRDDWLEVPKGERRRLVSAELQDANDKARLRRVAIDEASLKDFQGPVKAELAFDILSHFGDDHEASVTDSVLWAKLLQVTLDPERQVALELSSPFESVHRYSFRLSPAHRFGGVPDDQTIRSSWGSFRLTAWKTGTKDREIHFEMRTRIDKVRVEPADFAAFRQFQQDVIKHYRVYLTIEPTRDPADALMLEVMRALHPDDKHIATVLAELYLAAGNTARASAVLRLIRGAHPQDPKLAELAVKAAANSDKEEELYRELVKQFPKEEKYAVALGRVCVDRGQHSAARAVLGPLVRSSDKLVQAAAQIELARSCAHLDQAAEALKYLQAAAKADPESVTGTAALRLKAQLLEKMEQPKGAAETWMQLADLEPESKEALAEVVRLLLAIGDQPAAMPFLRRLTLVAGDDAAALTQAAEFHRRCGRLDDALDLASQALKRKAAPATERVLGLALLQRRDFPGAVAHLDKANLDEQVREARMRVYLALGKLAAAQQLVEQAPAAKVTLIGLLIESLVHQRTDLLRQAKVPLGKEAIWAAAADAYLCADLAVAENRSVEQVEQLLSGAFTDGVELGPAYGLRGLLAVERGRLSKATADAERAIALSPRRARGYYVRGRARLERGQPGALEDLAKGVELSQRGDADMLHWLAKARMQGGQRGQALADQRDAVKLKPGDKELTGQLREFEQAK